MLDADASNFANGLVVVRNYFRFALVHQFCVGFDSLRFLEPVVLPVVIKASAVILSDEILDFFD